MLTIEKGRALVLAGAQGSGKTEMARKIAEAGGHTWKQIDVSSLDDAYWSFLDDQPDVLIIDGLPKTGVALARVTKMLAMNDRPMCIYRAHACDIVLTNAPMIIICHDLSYGLAQKQWGGLPFPMDIHLVDQVNQSDIPAAPFVFLSDEKQPIASTDAKLEALRTTYRRKVRWANAAATQARKDGDQLTQVRYNAIATTWRLALEKLDEAFGIPADAPF